MPGPLLSIPEAASLLGISRIAVFKKVKAGLIPAFRVGRAWAISPADLTAYSARRAGTPSDRSGGRPSPDPSRPRPPVKPPKRAEAPPPPPGRPAAPETDGLDSMGWD